MLGRNLLGDERRIPDHRSPGENGNRDEYQKTLLQVATPSTTSIQVIEWGISFDGTVVNTPVQCELVDTETVGATSLTSLTPALYGAPTAEASLCVGGEFRDRVQLGGTAEGSITGTRYETSSGHLRANQYVKQFPSHSPLSYPPRITSADTRPWQAPR